LLHLARLAIAACPEKGTAAAA